MRTKPTIADLRAGRGTIQRSMVFVLSAEEAAAADEAGIDMLSIHGGVMSAAHRRAAPHCVIMSGLGFGTYTDPEDAVRRAFALLEMGADAIYCVAALSTISRLAEEGIPVVSHVGLIPSKATWSGGFRAVGKTADSATQVWRHVQRLESAGVFGTEIEVVPEAVATAIAKRTSLFMISMGAGSGCDAQYLFAEDIVGSNRGHYPRHAKRYRDFATEYDRLQQERIAAFREYIADIASGEFPATEHLVAIAEPELQNFLRSLDT